MKTSTANTTQTASIHLKSLKAIGTVAKTAGHGVNVAHALPVRLLAYVQLHAAYQKADALTIHIAA